MARACARWGAWGHEPVGRGWAGGAERRHRRAQDAGGVPQDERDLLRRGVLRRRRPGEGEPGRGVPGRGVRATPRHES